MECHWYGREEVDCREVRGFGAYCGTNLLQLHQLLGIYLIVHVV